MNYETKKVTFSSYHKNLSRCTYRYIQQAPLHYKSTLINLPRPLLRFILSQKKGPHLFLRQVPTSRSLLKNTITKSPQIDLGFFLLILRSLILSKSQVQYWIFYLLDSITLLIFFFTFLNLNFWIILQFIFALYNFLVESLVFQFCIREIVV